MTATPTSAAPADQATPTNTIAAPINRGSLTDVVICLYCGSPDDISEVPTTIDERTSGYALHCGLCQGEWTQ